MCTPATLEVLKSAENILGLRLSGIDAIEDKVSLEPLLEEATAAQNGVKYAKAYIVAKSLQEDWDWEAQGSGRNGIVNAQKAAVFKTV